MWKKIVVMLPEETATSSGGTATATPVESTTPAPVVETPAVETTNVGDDGSNVFVDTANEDLGMSNSDDEGVLPVQTPKGVKPTEPAPTPASVAEPAPVAVAQSTPVATPTPTPTPATSTPTPAPAATTPPAETVSTETNEQMQARIARERQQVMDNLTQQYAVPEESHAELLTEPEKVLPKLMAKMHMQVMDHLAQYVQAQLPRFLETHSRAKSAAQEASTAFFKEWPELNDPRYHQVVGRSLVAYRTANKDATPEQVIKEGGLQALIAARLPIPQRVLAQHNATAPNETTPTAFAPAVATSTSRPPAKPSTNVFTVLAEEALEEDLGG